MKQKLLIATAAAALMLGSSFALAQSPKSASEVKNGAETGDSREVGGTPAADRQAHTRQSGPATVNGAPVGSASQQADTIKENAETGDKSKVGGTTAGSLNADANQRGPLTENGAPIGSPVNKEEEYKQGVQSGDRSTQGGTPSKGKM